MAINNITQIKGSDTVETTIEKLNSNFQQLASLNGGPQGPAGVQGVPGLPGMQGLQGSQGEPGKNGDTIKGVNTEEMPDDGSVMEDGVSYIGKLEDGSVVMRKKNTDVVETGYDEVELISNKIIDSSGFLANSSNSDTNTQASYFIPSAGTNESKVVIGYLTEDGRQAVEIGDNPQTIGDSEAQSRNYDKFVIATPAQNEFNANYLLKDEKKSLSTISFTTYIKDKDNGHHKTFLCMADNTSDDENSENSLIMSFLGGNNINTSFYAHNIYAKHDIVTSADGGNGGFVGVVANENSLLEDNSFDICGLKNQNNKLIFGLNRHNSYETNYIVSENNMDIRVRGKLMLQSRVGTDIERGTGMAQIVLNDNGKIEMGSYGNIDIGTKVMNGENSIVTIGTGDMYSKDKFESKCKVNIGYGSGEVTIGGYINNDTTTETKKIGEKGRITIGAGGDLKSNTDDSTCDINIGYGSGIVTIGGYRKSKNDEKADDTDAKIRGSVIIGTRDYDRNIVIGALMCKSDIFIADGLNDVYLQRPSTSTSEYKTISPSWNGQSYGHLCIGDADHTETSIENKNIEITNTTYPRKKGDVVFKLGSFKEKGSSIDRKTIELFGYVGDKNRMEYIRLDTENDSDTWHASNIIIEGISNSDDTNDDRYTWITNKIVITYTIKPEKFNSLGVISKYALFKLGDDKNLYSLYNYVKSACGNDTLELSDIQIGCDYHTATGIKYDLMFYNYKETNNDVIITVPYFEYKE